MERLATRAFRAPKATQATPAHKEPKVMSAFVGHVVNLARLENLARVVPMASVAPLEVLAVVVSKEILEPPAPKVLSATRASRAHVAFAARLVSSERRARRASVVHAAIREQWA